MNYTQGKTYKDRSGNTHIFVERRGGVTVFRNTETGENLLLNTAGRYRWDDQDTPFDIVGEA